MPGEDNSSSESNDRLAVLYQIRELLDDYVQSLPRLRGTIANNVLYIWTLQPIRSFAVCAEVNFHFEIPELRNEFAYHLGLLGGETIREAVDNIFEEMFEPSFVIALLHYLTLPDAMLHIRETILIAVGRALGRNVTIAEIYDAYSIKH